MTTIQLSDSEWMDLIDQNREGLPPCCANISELRDALIALARQGGESAFGNFDRLKRLLGWCFPEHEVPSPTLQKVMDQVGFVPEGAAHHEPQSEFSMDGI